MLECQSATCFNHGSWLSQYAARMSTLADRIQQIMRETALKPKDLSKITGVSVQSISYWVNGQTKDIRNETLFKLARGTGYSPEWIATGEGPAHMIAIKHPEYIVDLEPLTPDQRVLIRAVVDAIKKQKTECG